MSDLSSLTPEERLSNVRANEIKANVGTITSLAGLGAAGLTAVPQLSRAKAVKRIAARSERAEALRQKVSRKKKKLDSAATKVFLYGAAPGAAVGLAHAHTARQDARSAKRTIRRDGSLRGSNQVHRDLKQDDVALAKSLRLARRVKSPGLAKIRQGGVVRRKTGGSRYRRGGIVRGR